MKTQTYPILFFTHERRAALRAGSSEGSDFLPAVFASDSVSAARRDEMIRSSSWTPGELETGRVSTDSLSESYAPRCASNRSHPPSSSSWPRPSRAPSTWVQNNVYFFSIYVIYLCTVVNEWNWWRGTRCFVLYVIHIFDLMGKLCITCFNW